MHYCRFSRRKVWADLVGVFEEIIRANTVAPKRAFARGESGREKVGRKNEWPKNPCTQKVRRDDLDDRFYLHLSKQILGKSEIKEIAPGCDPYHTLLFPNYLHFWIEFVDFRSEFLSLALSRVGSVCFFQRIFDRPSNSDPTTYLETRHEKRNSIIFALASRRPLARIFSIAWKNFKN